MPKRFLIAANWKMNPPPGGFDAPDSPYKSTATVEVVAFPTFLHIRDCVDAGLITGGQCGHPEKSGARTGDISMNMLQTAGCEYVLCGHSERRQSHGVTDEDVAAQVQAALAAKLIPILCVGESKREQEAGRGTDTVQRQLQAFQAGCVVAYEPVWAIGNEAADPKYAQEVHSFIRLQLPSALREKTNILYGGSVNPANAANFLSQPHVDGLLIGGASLKPGDFGKIVQVAEGLGAAGK